MPVSARSPALKRLRRLSGRRSARLDDGLAVAEGPHPVDEAVAAGATVVAVYHDGSGRHAATVAAARSAGAEVVEAGPEELRRALDTATPQGVAALVRWAASGWEALGAGAFVVVLDGLADPGNVGTLLRSALAAGAGGAVVTAATADVTGPKAVRASAGALFHLPVVVAADGPVAVGELRSRGWRCLGAVPQGGLAPEAVALDGAVAVVIGNEAHGLAPATVDTLDGVVTIPLDRRTESLNAAMAGTVLCFEAARQRRAAGGR